MRHIGIIFPYSLLRTTKVLSYWQIWIFTTPQAFIGVVFYMCIGDPLFEQSQRSLRNDLDTRLEMNNLYGSFLKALYTMFEAASAYIQRNEQGFSGLCMGYWGGGLAQSSPAFCGFSLLAGVLFVCGFPMLFIIYCYKEPLIYDTYYYKEPLIYDTYYRPLAGWGQVFL